ncbi:hypothetical protein J5N97_012846 [Dioscorea zingiberensis]|uniref:Uncharacterized protein n=1 Tax=Dioscorea zingiberensis TaxID=325984 RepID=A0A9D5HII3_9LILI|nr:hypothetical protein J5N97_012846 [Dioscorea zingiberensis]
MSQQQRFKFKLNHQEMQRTAGVLGGKMAPVQQLREAARTLVLPGRRRVPQPSLRFVCPLRIPPRVPPPTGPAQELSALEPPESGTLAGFLHPDDDVDLAEFAADMETLLGPGLDDDAFCMEGLGLDSSGDDNTKWMWTWRWRWIET